MALQPNYSDLLSAILEKKESKCICKSQFLASLKIVTPKEEESCEFMHDCQFSTVCSNNLAGCTCLAQCNCGTEAQQIMGSAKISPRKSCPQSNCICEGTCFYQSEKSILDNSIYQPLAHYDRDKCIRNVCLCRPYGSAGNLLPNCFRNNLKKEAHNMNMSDEMMKKECEEIKQLLDDHEQSQKKELKKYRSQSATDGVINKLQVPINLVSTAEEELAQRPVSPSKEGEKRQSIAYESTTEHNTEKSILRPTNENQSKGQSTKKEVKVQGNSKLKKPIKYVSTANTKTTKFTKHSRKSSVTRKRPLRIKYYFSGGVEHYGKKLGHKHCLDKPNLVPKHMGWLWNIEDQSKGIRERKGWPPGFIGKSIKNMIKGMKRFEGSDVAQGEVVAEARWKSLPMRGMEAEETEPQEEPPLLHIHKKGRTYNITFCPKQSDEDIGPIPIPFTITEKKHQSDTESSDSTLEFELHSPKPRGKLHIPKTPDVGLQADSLSSLPCKKNESPASTAVTNPSTAKVAAKKKVIKKKSRGSDENKVLWEEQQTQIQNMFRN